MPEDGARSSSSWPDAALRMLVEHELDQRTPGSAAVLAAAQRHALHPAGKLYRPLLLLRSGLACGGRVQTMLPAAVGFEFVHVATLIHDDIIDNDDWRRGRESVHRLFGMDQAILAGDALLVAWFRALADSLAHGAPATALAAAVRVQADTGAAVCQGASMELGMASRLDTDVDAYIEMARLKTGVLLGSACRIGAMLAGATEATALALAEAGEALGVAFQGHDDLLPFLQDDAESGKCAASDLRNKRPTLPVLLAYDAGSPGERTALSGMFSSRATEPHGLDRLARLLGSTGALARAQHVVSQHLGRFRALVEGALPPSAERGSLVDLARVLSRSSGRYSSLAGALPTGPTAW